MKRKILHSNFALLVVLLVLLVGAGSTYAMIWPWRDVYGVMIDRCVVVALTCLLLTQWYVRRCKDNRARAAADVAAVWLDGVVDGGQQDSGAYAAATAVLVRSDAGHLDQIVRDTKDCFVVVNRSGRIALMRGPCATKLGYDDKELIGEDIQVLFARGESWIPRVIREMCRSSVPERGRRMETSLRSQDGNDLQVLFSFSTFATAEGEIDGVVCTAQEIGALFEAENKLQVANLQLQLLNTMTVIALRTRECEPALSEMAETIRMRGGYPGVGFALTEDGRPSTELQIAAGFEVESEDAIAASTSDGIIDGAVLGQVCELNEPVFLHCQERRLTFRDSNLRSVEADVFCAFPMSVDGKVHGVLVLASNASSEEVTDLAESGADLARHIATLLDQKLSNQALRRSIEDLRQARRAAENASKAKSEFLANMSHEIRTPMTSILGYTELVSESAETKPDQQEEFIQTIRRNGEHLLSILNDILDISKIEAGQMSVESVLFSPAEIVDEVVEIMRARAEEKCIGVQAQFEYPLPLRIASDPTRLRQILVNLVGNAVKFTHSGGVRIVVRTEYEGDGSSLVFDVIDSGIGLEPTELERVFRAFSQADTSHTRKFGGTGLGLTISQRLAVLLGGRLTATSEKGKGSTFSASIAMGAVAPEDFAHGPLDLDRVGRLGAKRMTGEVDSVDADILLAEDGPDNQRLISHVLRKAGARVTVVDNGQIAIETALRAIENERPYDVIFMDMQMPVCDGYSATRELRKAGYDRPIIALTAHAMSGDRERCIAAGCDAFSTKPIKRKELIGLAAEYAMLARERARGCSEIG